MLQQCIEVGKRKRRVTGRWSIMRVGIHATISWAVQLRWHTMHCFAVAPLVWWCQHARLCDRMLARWNFILHDQLMVQDFTTQVLARIATQLTAIHVLQHPLYATHTYKTAINSVCSYFRQISVELSFVCFQTIMDLFNLWTHPGSPYRWNKWA